MIEKAEQDTSILLVEVKVYAVGTVDVVESEVLIEAKEAAVAPVIFILLLTWMENILISHKKYEAS